MKKEQNEIKELKDTTAEIKVMSSISVSGDDRIGSVYLEIEQQNSPTQKQKMKRASGISGTITKNPKDNNKRAKRQEHLLPLESQKKRRKRVGLREY